MPDPWPSERGQELNLRPHGFQSGLLPLSHSGNSYFKVLLKQLWIYLNLERTLRGSIIHPLALCRKDMHKDEKRAGTLFSPPFLKGFVPEKKRILMKRTEEYFIGFAQLMCAEDWAEPFTRINSFTMYNRPV